MMETDPILSASSSPYRPLASMLVDLYSTLGLQERGETWDSLW